MTHALENYNGTISIGDRKITNLRFAHDIDGITGEEDELTKLVHNLDTATAKFGMEISAGKTKIMTDNGTLQRDITIQGQWLETVDHFKYLGAIICDESSRREVRASLWYWGILEASRIGLLSNATRRKINCLKKC